VKAFLLSLLIAGLSILGLAALSVEAGLRFDYQAASEERQQAYLDGVVSAMRSSFARQGGSAEMTSATGDAAHDVVRVGIRFTDDRLEEPPGQQIEFLKQYMYTENCNYFATRAVIEKGVAIEFSIARPSGAPLADLSFTAQSCAPYAVASKEVARKSAR